MIPSAHPLSQYLSRKGEIDAALRTVLESGQYILGREVKAFETEFASYVGVRFGIGVASGTEALHLALRAAGVGRGDEVVTVSHTASATAAAIVAAGATPVFVDIHPSTWTLDPERLEAALTIRTRALLPVHLYGHPAEMDRCLEIARERSIPVVEDCAQAHGARYRGRRVGSLGALGCFSFYPTKNLGAIGDGGMVVTDDPALAERLRLLREYGWAERYVSHLDGFNSRLDEIQAAILRVKLRHLDEDNDRRGRIARRYSEGLAASSLGLPPDSADLTHVHHVYAVRTPLRDGLKAFLAGRGVATSIHYPVPLHLQPAYRKMPLPAGGLPETERAAREVLSLPIYPELPEAEVNTVIEGVLQGLTELRKRAKP